MADHLVGGLHCSDAEDFAAGFVLGVLEASEADAVRAHLAGCPEPHPAFAELGSVVPALLASVEPMEPPSTLKGFILAAAAADTQRERMPAADTQRADDTQRAAGTQRERMPAADTQRDTQRGGWASLFRRPVWAGVAMAAAIAAVALGVGYLGVRSELDAYRGDVAAVLDAAGRPGAQLASLAGNDGPIGLAALGTDGTIQLVTKDLQPTSGAQVYEAWLIYGKQSPVPIGGFAVGPDGTGSLRTAHVPLGEGVTVALTLEPGPGATTPTMPIIASGSALTPG